MRRSVGPLLVAAPLLAACAGSSAAAAHPAAGTSLACHGYYAISNDTVTANLTFSGPVRSVSLSAQLDDGQVRRSVKPVPVPAHAASQTVRLPGVDKAITSVIAYLTGAGERRGACELTNPH